MTTKEIAIKDKSYDLASAKQMTDMSALLKQHVVKQKLYTAIQGKNYVHTDGWQYAGGLMGLYPRMLEVENLSQGQETKWKATVEIVRLSDDKVVGRGFAICSNKESKKNKFDEYAILSMAQTRAIGKAYRNLVGWVMKLAGYESTPSEEMVKVGQKVNPPSEPPIKKTTAKPSENYECYECAEVITKAESDYSTKMKGKPLCRNCQKFAKKK